MDFIRQGCFRLCKTLSFFLFFLPASAQERVYLDLNAYSCKSGDTLWFKGTVTKDLKPSTISTNLYVEVCTKSGHPICREVFPLYRGQTIGQIIFKDSISTDNYYIAAFTKYNLNFEPVNSTTCFTVPVFVYNKEKPAIIPRKRGIKSNTNIASGKIDDFIWASNPLDGKLSSLLVTDLITDSRQLNLVKPIHGDSSLIASVSLGQYSIQKYALFPLDPRNDIQRLLLYKDSALIGKQYIHVRDSPEKIVIKTSILDLSPDGRYSLDIQMPDTLQYYTTISIADADRSIPSPTSIRTLQNSYTEDLTIPISQVDTQYITFTGRATTQLGNNIKGDFSREVFMAAVTDSSYLFSRVFSIDEKGRFQINSLRFSDSAAFQYQVNKEEDGHSKDIKLSLNTNLDTFVWPTIDSSLFLSAWEDDNGLINAKDTGYTKNEQAAYETSRMKMLQPAIVKGWKNSRKELDDVYTTGPFSEPALYSYDLRTYSSEYRRDIFWYINTHPECGLSYDPVGDTLKEVNHHPIHYFVDEVEYDAPTLHMFDFDKLAYIKVLESDFLSTNKQCFSLVNCIGQSHGSSLLLPEQKTAVNVLIYTRKGKDFRTMKGGLNTMRVRGFGRALPFSPNNRALYWDPLQVRSGTFAIQFNSPENCRRFRVRISGVAPDGKVVYCEKIVPVTDDLMRMADKGRKNQDGSAQSSQADKVGEDTDDLTGQQQ